MQAALDGLTGKPGVPATLLWQPGATYRCERELDIPPNVIVDLNDGTLLRTVPNPFGVEAVADTVNDRFNYVAHGMDGTAPVKITGGVKFTTGIVNGGVYWPVTITANTFQLSLTMGGAPIALGSTPSGTTGVDTQINMSNAASPNPRAFLFSSDFPGNDNYDNPQIRAEGSSGVRFTSSAGRGTITGAQTNGRLGVYDPRYEGQAGILIAGGNGSEIDTIDIESTLGDSIEYLQSLTAGRPSNGHIHDVTMVGSGRQGFTVGNGGATNILLEDYTIIGSPRHLIDIESDAGGSISGLTIRRGYCQYGTHTLGWIAAGGNTTTIPNLVIGGLLGHASDGNLVVGGPMSFDGPTPDGIRRGPYTLGYNIGGGQLTLHTTAGSPTATYSGYVNPSGGQWTDAQIMQLQVIFASTLPIPCQINSVSGTTITLSHNALTTGTVTAIFGTRFSSAAGNGAFLFRHIDGANAFFNVGVLDPTRGDVGSLFHDCSLINDHDDTWFGGNDFLIVP